MSSLMFSESEAYALDLKQNLEGMFCFMTSLKLGHLGYFEIKLFNKHGEHIRIVKCSLPPNHYQYRGNISSRKS